MPWWIHTVEPLLSGLMTGYHWPDNRRWPENNLLMPPYVYVKIIGQITSYSTLFILKRNTGNCFYLLSYVRLSGIFFEKVRQKTFRSMCFCLSTCSLTIFLSGVDIRTAIRSQLHPCTESGEELHTGERHGLSNSRLIKARIIEVLLYFFC
jgi:hypothetical protein